MLQVIAEQWISRDPRMALYLMSKYKQMRELEKHAVVSMVIALVVVPLFPLCVIVLWNMLKPRRVSKGDLNETFSHSSSGGLHSDSDKKGGVNNKGEHAAAAVYQALHIQESATGGYTIEYVLILAGISAWNEFCQSIEQVFRTSAHFLSVLMVHEA